MSCIKGILPIPDIWNVVWWSRFLKQLAIKCIAENDPLHSQSRLSDSSNYQDGLMRMWKGKSSFYLCSLQEKKSFSSSLYSETETITVCFTTHDVQQEGGRRKLWWFFSCGHDKLDVSKFNWVGQLVLLGWGIPSLFKGRGKTDKRLSFHSTIACFYRRSLSISGFSSWVKYLHQVRYYLFIFLLSFFKCCTNLQPQRLVQWVLMLHGSPPSDTTVALFIWTTVYVIILFTFCGSTSFSFCDKLPFQRPVHKHNFTSSTPTFLHACGDKSCRNTKTNIPSTWFICARGAQRHASNRAMKSLEVKKIIDVYWFKKTKNNLQLLCLVEFRSRNTLICILVIAEEKTMLHSVFTAWGKTYSVWNVGSQTMLSCYIVGSCYFTWFPSFHSKQLSYT